MVNAISMNVRQYLSGDTELDGYYKLTTLHIPVNEIALILIDVWADNPMSSFQERVDVNIKDYIVPLLDFCRDAGIKIIHAPHLQVKHKSKPRYTIHEAVFREGEKILGIKESTSDALTEYLKREGFTTILYAGYAVNLCVPFRPVGMFNMRNKRFKLILVRDCTLAIETKVTFANEGLKYAFINTIDRFFFTASLEDMDVIRAK